MTEVRPKPGVLFRITRWGLVALAAWLALSWIVSVTGLYFWFSVGTHDRVRIEYGRMKWTHSDGRPVRGNSGLDGGASKAEWDFELSDTGHGFIARIPLWAPFAAALFLIALMTWVHRVRTRPDRRLPREPDGVFT